MRQRIKVCHVYNYLKKTYPIFTEFMCVLLFVQKVKIEKLCSWGLLEVYPTSYLVFRYILFFKIKSQYFKDLVIPALD